MILRAKATKRDEESALNWTTFSTVIPKSFCRRRLKRTQRVFSLTMKRSHLSSRFDSSLQEQLIYLFENKMSDFGDVEHSDPSKSPPPAVLNCPLVCDCDCLIHLLNSRAYNSCTHPEASSFRTIISVRCDRRWVSAAVGDTLHHRSIKLSGCKGHGVRAQWRLWSKRSAYYSPRISLPLTRPWNEPLPAWVKGCSDDSITLWVVHREEEVVNTPRLSYLIPGRDFQSCLPKTKGKD